MRRRVCAHRADQPYSALTGAAPVLKSSDHFFFKLSDPRCVEFLQQWTTGANRQGVKHLQAEVQAKTREWLVGDDGEAKLGDWDISRDAPISASRFPTRRASISMSGWTRRWATWPR